MSTTLVTGGAGFIGSNCVRQRLNQSDVGIVVLNNLTFAGSRDSLPEDKPARWPRRRMLHIGGSSEKTDLEIVDTICDLRDRLVPASTNPAITADVSRYGQLKTLVPDRKAHDWRYAIDAAKIQRELGWSPGHRFDEGSEATVKWYIDNRDWCEKVQARAKYRREGLGLEE